MHGLHYWAATLMVVLALLHLVQVFLWGAFKKPREMTWLLGVLLLLGTLGAVFTGGPLPWDEKGYWAARVGAGIAGSVPLVGSWVRDVVFGGPTVGAADDQRTSSDCTSRSSRSSSARSWRRI